MTELCTMEDMLSTLEDDISHRTGRALKQRREAAGLSLRMLAERSGISSSMISDIERGAKSPTVVTVVRLAQALGVGAAALIDGGEAPASRIRVLRRGEGTSGATPAPWETLGPATPGSPSGGTSSASRRPRAVASRRPRAVSGRSRSSPPQVGSATALAWRRIQR